MAKTPPKPPLSKPPPSKPPLIGAESGPITREMLEAMLSQIVASRTTDAVDEAQEVMFDAWECEVPKRRIALARKALKISADCADAYLLLAEEWAATPGAALDLLVQAVAAGERALGKAAFVDDIGDFWGLIETRPYMRARLSLAQALWGAGNRDEAAEHLIDMIRLNPNDNQGARYQPGCSSLAGRGRWRRCCASSRPQAIRSGRSRPRWPRSSARATPPPPARPWTQPWPPIPTSPSTSPAGANAPRPCRPTTHPAIRTRR